MKIMWIDKYIQKEREVYIKEIKKDLKEGVILIEDLNETRLAELDEEIEASIVWELNHSVRFNLLNEDGKLYKTMLGTGYNIDFDTVYEIVKRLYMVHHESQKFILEFNDYQMELNFEKLNGEKIITRLILDEIGYDYRFKISDFQ